MKLGGLDEKEQGEGGKEIGQEAGRKEIEEEAGRKKENL